MRLIPFDNLTLINRPLFRYFRFASILRHYFRLATALINRLIVADSLCCGVSTVTLLTWSMNLIQSRSFCAMHAYLFRIVIAGQRITVRECTEGFYTELSASRMAHASVFIIALRH